jgi:hypothetical protein
MFSLRMSFSFGRPSCGCALRCVVAPNLRTCRRALHLHCRCAHRLVGAPNLRTCLATCRRCGAQLADVPCDAFGRPSYRRALCCVGVPKLGEAVLKSLPPSGCALRYVGAPTCGHADVPCVCVADVRWARNMQTCLALRWGDQPR